MATIGLVHRNDDTSTGITAGDLAVESLLQGAGHTVVRIEDNVSPPGGVDCYVITEAVTADLPATQYAQQTLPFLSMDIGTWDNMGYAAVPNSNGGSYRFFDLEEHEITAGISPLNDVEVRSTNGGTWGVAGGDSNVPASAEIFARKGDDANHIMGYAVPAGGVLQDGVSTAPARRVFLAYIDNWYELLTEAGQTLLLQSVEWLLGGAEEPPEGTSEGSTAWAGTSIGARDSDASAAGTAVFTGTSAGARDSAGTGTGSAAWAGSAEGEAPAPDAEGAAAGTVAWAAIPVGARDSDGVAATGVVTVSGSVSGFTPPEPRDIEVSVFKPFIGWEANRPTARRPQVVKR